MFKRIFDFTAASFCLLLLSPIVLMLVLFVRVRLGSPILFVQERPGLDGRIFKIMKFRTMVNARDQKGNLLPDHQRMTRFGSFLRSTSLDEIPSLINVLKGDMSFVGPRPLLVEYLPLYNKWQARRHNVKPGITGWAQVNGRNAINWEDKFRYDIWYLDNKSFWLDIKILLLTIRKVFKREGVNADKEVTMPRFTGEKHSNE